MAKINFHKEWKFSDRCHPGNMSGAAPLQSQFLKFYPFFIYKCEKHTL